MDSVGSELDARLAGLGRREAQCRQALGQVAARFLDARAHHRLGFARVSDYARERLGISARELHDLAHVAEALADLPQLAAACMSGEISWTKARLLAGVARAGNENAWLSQARAHTTRELRTVIRRTLDPLADAGADDYDPGAADADDAIDGERPARFRLPCTRGLRRIWHNTIELARRAGGEQGPVWRAAEAIAAEALSGPAGWVGEHARGGARYGAAGDAGDDAGDDGMGLVATAVLANGEDPTANHSFGDPTAPGTSGVLGDRAGASTLDAEPVRDAQSMPTSRESQPVPDARPTPATRREATASVEAAGANRDAMGADPIQLDRRMIAILSEMRGLDFRIGRTLRAAVALRLHRRLGFASVATYAVDRLGISASKARALLALERRIRHAPQLADAYRRGLLSWVRTLTVVPVASGEHAAAWIERANTVTVRRLEAEVAWAVGVHDASPTTGMPGPPGPEVDVSVPDVDAGSPDVSPDGPEDGLPSMSQDVPMDAAAAAGEPASRVERQMGAHPTGVEEPPHACSARPPVFIADVEITFVGPRSVVALLHSALPAFARPREPRWRAMARLLQHVRAEWLGQPRHRDPIFARDGWRCAVPACGSRRNLHDHHVRYRSRGGGNEQSNRITVCAWHHLHGIHAGRVRAAGTAPDRLEWELGIDGDGRASWRFHGDRYVA